MFVMYVCDMFVYRCVYIYVHVCVCLAVRNIKRHLNAAENFSGTLWPSACMNMYDILSLL